VRLFAVEPDIARFLGTEERQAAGALAVPVRELGQGLVGMDSVLHEARAFGAFILKGIILYRLQVGDQPALRLLGPGDMLLASGTAPSMLVEARCRVAAPTQLALLGDEILLAAHRWPALVAGLCVRMGDQADRLGTQLAICQLPRVDQRLLALMWMLAESWGHVTPHGTRLPLVLTHDVIGGLIGARRPTVTLALRDLSDRGAIVRQDEGWLLLEPPAAPTETDELPEPVLIDRTDSGWAVATAPARAPDQTYAELKETVSRMRAEYAYNQERFRERLDRLTMSRQQATLSRRKIAKRKLSPRRAPS
jgi:hypothetical protein